MLSPALSPCYLTSVLPSSSVHFVIRSEFLHGISLLSRSLSGCRRCSIGSSLLREGKRARPRARLARGGSASRREMLSRFCRRHHLSRRKAPCITSGVYPRSRHPVVTGHLLPPSSTGLPSLLSRATSKSASTLFASPSSRSSCSDDRPPLLSLSSPTSSMLTAKRAAVRICARRLVRSCVCGGPLRTRGHTGTAARNRHTVNVAKFLLNLVGGGDFSSLFASDLTLASLL